MTALQVKNTSTRVHLLALLRIVLDSSSTDVFSPHYPLFSSQVGCLCEWWPRAHTMTTVGYAFQVLAGFTDARVDVRKFAFEVLTFLMQKFPSLCAGDRDLFDKYLVRQ